MDDSKELEKLIAKSRIQIEEREKLIKEMQEARELDEKRRALQQLTTETELLKSEASRLKAEIERDRAAIQTPPRPRENPYFDRRERTTEIPVPRESSRDRAAEQAKFNDALLEVTREIRAELARQREITAQKAEAPRSAPAPSPYPSAPVAPAPYPSHNAPQPYPSSPAPAPKPAPSNKDDARLISQELKELRAELARQAEAVKEATRLVRAVPSSASTSNPAQDKARDEAIAELRREIKELERDVTRAQQVSQERANKAAAETDEASNLFAETRKLRSEFDRQKIDNFKRDRDMTRVIDLLEKIADEDE